MHWTPILQRGCMSDHKCPASRLCGPFSASPQVLSPQKVWRNVYENSSWSGGVDDMSYTRQDEKDKKKYISHDENEEDTGE